MQQAEKTATGSKWEAVVNHLRCTQCGGPMQPKSPAALQCAACAREFPIEREVLRLNPKYQGNNAIAAEYYNSSLWPKFRFWEWVAHLPRGGERKARNEVVGHLKNLSGTRLLEV